MGLESHVSNGSTRCPHLATSTPRHQPVVTGVFCSDGELSFTAYQSFKLAYDYPGGYKVTKSDGTVLVDYTSFDFAAFQRETVIEGVDVGSSECGDSDHPCVLAVSNQIEDKTSVEFKC